jgi:hypothetical protein
VENRRVGVAGHRLRFRTSGVAMKMDMRSAEGC